MKIKSKIRKTFIALSLLIAITFTIPAYAADGNDETHNDATVINYDDIEDLVLKNNLRLKSNKYTIEDMEDIIDDIYDARDEIREMLSNSPGSGPSMPIDMPSTTEVSENMQLAELNFAYAEKQIVSASQELFVLYHQIDNNLVQLERNSQMLESNINKAKISYDYGYILASTVEDLETQSKELANKYNSLLQQKELLLLNFKNLVGASNSKEITLGNMPELDREFLTEIDLENDIKEAINSSMTIEIKKKELRNADASSKRVNNEAEIRKKEIEAELTNQYQLLLQKYDDLILADNNLKRSEDNLFKGYIQLNAGNITKSKLDSLINEVENQKSTIEIYEGNLFKELEKYKDMVAGMI